MSDWEDVSVGPPSSAGAAPPSGGSPDDWEDVAVGPEPTLSGDARAIGNSFVKGVSDTAGLVYDASRLFNHDYSVFSDFGDAGKSIYDTAKDYGVATDAKPKTAAGRIIGRGAEFLPSAALPVPGGLGLRLATALGSGLGAGAAEEVSNSPYVSAAGSLVGGLVPGGAAALGGRLARSAGAVVKPLLGQLGEESIAGNVIKDATAGTNIESDLQAALQAPKTPFSAYQSSAELTQSPGLAAIQKNVERSSPPLADIAATKSADRQDLRTALLQNVGGPEAELPREVAGQQGRSFIQAALKDTKQAEGAAFDAVDPGNTTRIPIYKAKMAAQDAAVKYFGKGTSGMDADLAKLLEDFTDPANKNAVDWRTLQNFRSRALSIGRQAGRAGDSAKAAVANSMATAMDDAGSRAATSLKGFTPAQANAWKTARGITGSRIQRFGQKATKQVLGKTGEGDFKVLDENVLSRFSKSPTLAGQYGNAVANDPAAMNLLRGQMINELSQRRVADIPRALQLNMETLKKAFHPKHIEMLNQLAQDITSEASVSKLASQASKGQSNTYQNLTTGQFIRDKITSDGRLLKFVLKAGGTAIGAKAGGVPGAVLGSMVGGRLESSIGNATERVNQLLFQAAHDPSVAYALVQKATPARIETTLKDVLKAAGQSAVTTGENAPAMLPAAPKALPAPVVTNSPTQEPDVMSLYTSMNTPPAAHSARVPGPYDSEILNAMAHVESKGKQSAVSKKGARGVMQVMPKTAEWIAGKLGDKYDPSSKEQNLRFGKWYYEHLVEMFGDHELAQAAYNAGPKTVKDAIKKAGSKSFEAIAQYLPEETQNYVAQIGALLNG